MYRKLDFSGIVKSWLARGGSRASVTSSGVSPAALAEVLREQRLPLTSGWPGGKCLASAGRQWGSVWSLRSNVTSLSLSFHICKMGVSSA